MNRVVLPVLLLVAAGLGFNTLQTTQDIAPKLIQATVEISVKEKKDDLFSHVGTGWLCQLPPPIKGGACYKGVRRTPEQ